MAVMGDTEEKARYHAITCRPLMRLGLASAQNGDFQGRLCQRNAICGPHHTSSRIPFPLMVYAKAKQLDDKHGLHSRQNSQRGSEALLQ